MAEDRRKHARFKSATIVQYQSGIFQPSRDTVTKDVGVGGLCFFSEKKLKFGQIVKLKIFYDGKSSAKILKAQVVWSKEYCDEISKGYLNGLSFIPPSQKRPRQESWRG